MEKLEGLRSLKSAYDRKGDPFSFVGAAEVFAEHPDLEQFYKAIGRAEWTFATKLTERLSQMEASVETCPTCMGSGYGGHPDSGAVCGTCGGSGGILP